MAKKVTPLPALDAQTDQKTEFFMTASHQLKSPVAIVQWCLQSVMEDAAISADTKKLVRRALSQADAMSTLLSDMLKVFRFLRHDDGSVTMTPVDINAVLDQVFEQYEPIAHQRRVHLIKIAIEKVPNVLADEGYFKQAVINLIDNAIKYTPEHGKVEVSLKQIGHHIELAVSDTGIGIADADQSRMFTEFFRSEQAKETTHDGTGLGLVLVKHIIERFGGTINFTSQLGKGTTFTLRIPTASAGR